MQCAPPPPRTHQVYGGNLQRKGNDSIAPMAARPAQPPVTPALLPGAALGPLDAPATGLAPAAPLDTQLRGPVTPTSDDPFAALNTPPAVTAGDANATGFGPPVLPGNASAAEPIIDASAAPPARTAKSSAGRAAAGAATLVAAAAALLL